MPVMTFGKHKGAEVSDLPDDYLGWVVHEATVHDRALGQALADEWERRTGMTVEAALKKAQDSAWQFYSASKVLALTMVQAGYELYREEPGAKEARDKLREMVESWIEPPF